MNNLHISSGEVLRLAEGAARYTTIDGGKLVVCSAASVTNTDVNQEGELVFAPGTSGFEHIVRGGRILVSAGAEVNTAIFESAGGYLGDGYLFGTLYAAELHDGGQLSVLRGGWLHGATVSSGGCLIIREGGKADGIFVSSGGELWLDGGCADRVQFGDGARIQVDSGTLNKPLT